MKIKFRADLGNKSKFIVKRRMLDITAINQDVYINNRTEDHLRSGTRPRDGNYGYREKSDTQGRCL